jgi:hypothetical protein
MRVRHSPSDIAVEGTDMFEPPDRFGVAPFVNSYYAELVAEGVLPPACAYQVAQGWPAGRQSRRALSVTWTIIIAVLPRAIAKFW